MDSTYILLQHYWWFLVSLLGALLVFLLFVQGGQSLLFTIGKTELQQKMLLNSTGRKWEFTFTTLVTFGGAFFASFPLFYSTSFGGAYWVWMLILACFVLQAVSYEYQSKKGNLLGKKTYQVFLLLNGILGPILLGTAVGTFFSGAEFVVNKGQLTDVAMPVISTWATPWHGLEAAFVFWNVCLGLAVFFLARIQALLYFINNIDDAEIVKRSRTDARSESRTFSPTLRYIELPSATISCLKVTSLLQDAASSSVMSEVIIFVVLAGFIFSSAFFEQMTVLLSGQ